MILIIGGSGSGKSAYAEKRLCELKKIKKLTPYYLATMQPFGKEGAERVEKHRKMREGKGFITIEQPRNISAAADSIKVEKSAVLLECVSNLVANEMFSNIGTEHDKDSKSDQMNENVAGSILPENLVVDKVVNEIGRLNAATDELIIVSNNVFEDGCIYDEITMQYIRALGKINQGLSKTADEVYEVTAGMAVRWK